MKYIMTYTAKRKNAKRHILYRGDNIEELEKKVEGFTTYIYEVYNSKWELVKVVNS